MSKYNKTERLTENKLMVTREERGRRRGEIGEGDSEVRIGSYKVNKSQGCNVQHRDYSLCFIITLYGM